MKTIYINHSFKIIGLFLLLSVNLTAFAQTGIGTTTPDASAKLEVASTNKGFLPPRVALTATNSASPITIPATGLLIFNTASAGTIPNQVSPGYYYWDGVSSKWFRLEDKADNLGNHTATDNIRLNGYYLSNDGGNEGIRVDNSGNIGMGTSSLDASSILDITSSSKGLLPPRVALIAKSGTSTPIASPATGLVVYNTATAGATSDAVSPGYYYYTGTVWTRMDPDGWSTGVPITIGAVTTAPTKGTTTTDYVRYRNVFGKEYEVEYNLVQTAAGTAGNGDYFITLPGGLQFDYTAQGQSAYTGAGGGYYAIVARLVSANGDLYHSGAHNSATAVPYDATRFRIHTNNWGSVGWTFLNASYYQLSVASAGFKMFFRFKAL